MIHIRSTTTTKEVEDKGHRSKSNGHKDREQDNSYTTLCTCGGQPGFKSQTIRIYCGPSNPRVQTVSSTPECIRRSPTPMEEDNTEEDDLMEEDMVD